MRLCSLASFVVQWTYSRLPRTTGFPLALWLRAHSLTVPYSYYTIRSSLLPSQNIVQYQLEGTYSVVSRTRHCPRYNCASSISAHISTISCQYHGTGMESNFTTILLISISNPSHTPQRRLRYSPAINYSYRSPRSQIYLVSQGTGNGPSNQLPPSQNRVFWAL